MVIIPSHKTHEVVGITLTPVVFYATYTYTQDSTTSLILSGLYVFSTFFISPDLDTDSAPYYRWNIFSLLWYPYKRLIPHRSWLSHSGPISGTIRFLYMLFWFVVFAYVFHFSWLTYLPLYAMLWMSIILVDSLHTLLDYVF